MTKLQLIVQNDKLFLEGPVSQPLLHEAVDVRLLIEAGFSYQTGNLLLYAENLTNRFFDLSSQEAGTILQKLRQYQIRLAVVGSSRTRPPSRRFDDLMAEEKRNRYFRLFATRSEAVAWLLDEEAISP
ncbi:MAG: DUF4180 domain-containing protein [Chloroflexota bacterium]|jgi:hypothetical protein